ncbi:hypothetical protein H1R20_g14149, partial [Candolleomyces eurysporus]
MIVGQLKDNPDYPKLVHRRDLADAQVAAIQERDNEHSGDEEHGEYAVDEEDEQERKREHVVEARKCGCCFDEIANGHVTRCPGDHAFCTDCIVGYASVELGGQKSILKCMDTSECDQIFSDRELRLHLPDRLIQLYDQLTQHRELREANIEGLEDCPFCPWAQIVDGYGHFCNNERSFEPDGRCLLWDTKPLKELHLEEVQAAAKRALNEQKPIARAAATRVVQHQHQRYAEPELVHDARGHRWVVKEEAFERAVLAHGAGPEVAAPVVAPLEQREYDDLNGRRLAEGNRRVAEHARLRVDPGDGAARDVGRVIRQPPALVHAHARDQVQVPDNLEQLQQEMAQAKHEASLARRRATEAQKRVDEVRGREKLYYQMLNAGMDVHPKHDFCFYYPPGIKRIRKTPDGFNPKRERKAREAHLQFALDEEQQYMKISDAAYKRLREARAALRKG